MRHGDDSLGDGVGQRRDAVDDDKGITGKRCLTVAVPLATMAARA